MLVVEPILSTSPLPLVITSPTGPAYAETFKAIAIAVAILSEFSVFIDFSFFGVGELPQASSVPCESR